MNYLDAILNLAIVLLWLQWRSARTAHAPVPLRSLLALLKPTDRPGANPRPLLAIAAIILLRGFFYWQIGAPLGWRPTLRLGTVPVHFRSDYLGLTLAYSALAALHAIVVVWLWLALLQVIHRHATAEEPFPRWVRRQLGRCGQWPWWTGLCWPLLAGFGAWLALYPLFRSLELLPAAVSARQLTGQALVVGLGAYLAWQPLLLGLLGLHVLNSYIYFGVHPFWAFIESSGRRMLGPLAPLPLRVGRIDFAPVPAIALLWAIGWWLAHTQFGLPRAFQLLPR